MSAVLTGSRAAAASTRRLPYLLAVIAAAAVLSFFKTSDPDFFWHLATGRVILEQGHVVRTNLFSAFHADHPWPNPEVLFQVAIAAVQRLGGWEAVTLLKVALSCVLGALLFVVLAERAERPFFAASLAVLALSLVRSRLTERPQLLSLIFFVSVVLIVQRHRRRGGRLVWALPPLFALWSNIHPELILGFLYLAAEFVGSWPRRTDRTLLAATLLSVPATLLNPEGSDVLAFPFLHLFLSPVIEVSEYAFSSPAAAPAYWILLVIVVAVLLRPGAQRRWSEILPAAGMALLGALYLRSIPYFVFTAAIVLQGNLAAWPVRADRRPRRWLAAGAGAIAAGAFTWALLGDRSFPYRWGVGLDERLYPAAAADLLAARPFPPNLYNGYNVGGYLAFRLYPKMGIFQDGRVQAYPSEFISRLHNRHGGENWPRLFAEFKVNTLLVRRGEAPLFAVGGDWGVVFWDDEWVILVRRDPANAASLERDEYRIFLPDQDPRAMSDPRQFPRILSEMERNQRERRQPSAFVATEIGVLFGRFGRYAEAEKALRTAVALDPLLAGGWSNLGIALVQAGRREEGARALREALRLDPDLKVARSRLQALE